MQASQSDIVSFFELAGKMISLNWMVVLAAVSYLTIDDLNMNQSFHIKTFIHTTTWCRQGSNNFVSFMRCGSISQNIQGKLYVSSSYS